MCRSATCLLALAVALPLLIPAAARADRDPTKGERAAIERVVRRHTDGAHIRVIVSNVRISTADSHWATAAYSVRFQKSGVRQDVETLYRRAKGRGWNTSYTQVPAAVEADLGWGDPDTTLEKVVRIATYVVMGIAALGPSLCCWGGFLEVASPPQARARHHLSRLLRTSQARSPPGKSSALAAGVMAASSARSATVKTVGADIALAEAGDSVKTAMARAECRVELHGAGRR